MTNDTLLVRGSRVGIIGGSIAGCATAIALARLGCDVQVFERSSGVLRDSAWYYVQSTVGNYTYHPPRVIDRKVVAVDFAPNGRVSDIRRYGLAEGRIIDLENRTTGTGGREMSIIEQLFGNLLNIDAQQLNNP